MIKFHVFNLGSALLSLNIAPFQLLRRYHIHFIHSHLPSAEPDVRAQDGVYSRYLPRLSTGGRLLLEVTAAGSNGAASVVTQRRSGEELLKGNVVLEIRVSFAIGICYISFSYLYF